MHADCRRGKSNEETLSEISPETEFPLAVSRDGDEDVLIDGHGMDRVAAVVDVLPDEVDTTRHSDHDLRGAVGKASVKGFGQAVNSGPVIEVGDVLRLHNGTNIVKRSSL